jgi:YaiO family outer membrane protein
LIIRFLSLVLILCALCGSAAVADQQAQFTYTFISFSSPRTAYGPWDIDDLRYIDTQPGQSLTLDLSHRDDQDRFFPTSGNYGSLSYSRDLSSRFYANAAAGFGSGDPFATSTLHLEGDYKASSDYRVVLGAFCDTISYAHALHSNDAGMGLAYYWLHATVQLREYSISNTGSPTRANTFASLELKPDAVDDIVVNAFAGPQLYEVVIPGIPAAFNNSSGWVATVSYQHWLTRTFGLIGGAYVSNATQNHSGDPISAGRGITVGASVR